MVVWVTQEVEQCEFADLRLKTRLAKLLGELGRKIGETLPSACQDWAATKAAYRFLSNPRANKHHSCRPICRDACSNRRNERSCLDPARYDRV
jgi:hypothetical protein